MAGIHAVDLVWGLGAVHCLTQQQPAGRASQKGGKPVSKWVVLCPDCGQEFKIDVESVPERCPFCKYEGDFEIVDEDE